MRCGPPMVMVAVTLLAASAQGRLITIAAVGDIMMGTTYPEEKLPPRDGEGLFDGAKAFLSGHDIVFGNLEAPLIDGGTPRKCADEDGPGPCFEFRTPVRYARHLARAGFNAVSIANNHVLDFGEEGRRSTITALREAGVQPLGGHLIARFVVSGKRVALAGFSFSSSVTRDYSVLEVPAAAATVARLKKEHDIVIVSFHGGTEGSQALEISAGPEYFGREPRGDVVRFARAVVDAGADLVLGHGPHVLRAAELHRGRLIAYSLGNFVGCRGLNVSGPNGISMILQASLDGETGRFVRGRIIPVKLRNGGVPGEDREGRAIATVKRLSVPGGSNAELALSDHGALMLLEPPVQPGEPTLWQRLMARLRQLRSILGSAALAGDSPRANRPAASGP